MVHGGILKLQPPKAGFSLQGAKTFPWEVDET
jgi:hypothetical protein